MENNASPLPPPPTPPPLPEALVRFDNAAGDGFDRGLVFALPVPAVVFPSAPSGERVAVRRGLVPRGNNTGVDVDGPVPVDADG